MDDNSKLPVENIPKADIISSSQVKPGTIDPRALVVPTSPKNGDMFYSDGTNFQKIAAGTNGQVITANATGVPVFTTPATTNFFPKVTALSGTTPTLTCTGLQNIIFTISLSGNTTYSISGAQAGQLLMVEVTQGSGTTYTNTWFSGITWVTSGGTAPVQTTVSTGITTYGFRVLTTSTFLGYLVGNRS